ncbi:MAG: beta-N-acetylhexosaminidase [Pseudonocardiales bacterium]|nr:beta-N-acetylhexosaminidase [Pseudonocardiales bacterium]
MRPRPPRRLARSARPLLAGVLAGLVAAGIVIAVRPGAAPHPASVAAPVPSTPAGAQADRDRVIACAPIVARLAPRDRLAQRLVVGVDAAAPNAVVEAVRATQVGGIFLGGNATALLQNQALRRVQSVARIPVAVSVDDEGGRVQRIDALDGSLPSARRMARMPVEQVRTLARERGRKLAARGVTIDFAPVVDVGDQPAGDVIGDRSFGADPAVAARYAGAFADGLRDAGVLPVLKHFPGHGHANGDSHQGRVTTPPLDRLRADDLRPYADLLGTGSAAVMVGHLDVPGLTDGLPTSLTPATYRLLRDDYRFDGLVVTDDLGAMKAVTGTFTLPEAVLRALSAGADAGLWSSGAQDAAGIAPVLDLLEKALADGRLDPAANDRAVARVLAAKGICA